MKNYTTIKARLLKNQATRRAYGELEPEYNLARAIIRKRIQKGLTQEALARKIGTKQSAISRLESGAGNPTISFLGDIAGALGSRLKISI